MKHSSKIKFALFIYVTFSGVLSHADVSYFKGSISLDSASSKSPIPNKVIVTVKVTSKMPVEGKVADGSHVVTDPVSSKKSVVCEYHYTFSPSQVAITVSTENGNTLSGTTSDVNVSGTIYTDASNPDSEDVTQCKPPAADKFPVSGPMDVTIETLKNFQLSDNLLLSLDPAKQIFKNTGTLDLKNKDVTSPLLTNLMIDSLEKMTWTTFGTDATTKTGSLTFTPSATE